MELQSTFARRLMGQRLGQMIGFNGCSQVAMTNLNYLSEWESKSWPALVAKKLEQDYINVAQTMSSNQRILRTSIDLVINKNISKLIIGWTSISRYELPMANGDIVRLGPYGNITEYAINSPDSSLDIHKEWYANHHNEWLSFIAYLEQIILLEALCRSYNVELFMFNAVDHNFLLDLKKFRYKNFWIFNKQQTALCNEEFNYVSNLQQQILNFNWLMSPDYTFTDLCMDRGLRTDQGIHVKGGHPEIEAQSVIAEIFINKIKDITK